ncbi:MAG: AMP-binding protein [Pseudomonadota bacterium]
MVTGTDFSHLPALFFSQVESQGKRLALSHKDRGIWKRISWEEYGKRVRTAAAGLIALGLEFGDRVAILGFNRPEWVICHLGVMTAGGVTCGIYPTSSSEEIAYLVGHSGSKIIFVENEEHVEKLLEVIEDLEVDRVVIWDPEGLWGFSHPRMIFLEEFLALGRQSQDRPVDSLAARLDRLAPEDTAMIVYTSGTTGRPKGAMISHRNILSVTESYYSFYGFDETYEVVSYLPYAHIFENIFSLFQAVRAGGLVNFVESLETLPQNLKEISPTVFAGVPRIWEKIASRHEIRMSDAPYFNRMAYRMAISVALAWVRLPKNSPKRFWLRPAYSLAYWTVLHHIKRQMGFDRLRLGACGAAPASRELFEFYKAIGVPLKEGYGQTESTGVIAAQSMTDNRLEYVGTPLPGLEVKIAEDGEILAKGPGVFKGYFRDPELTAETIKDGWLFIGDVGMLDNGQLKILDRKKDIIITAGGKNITPAFIENKLKFSTYIQDAVIIGDRRKYLTALVLIDEDNVMKYAQDNRLPFTTFEDLTRNPDVIQLISREVDLVNKTLAKVETVKKFALLPRRLYVEDGDVTPTGKIKRRYLEKRYIETIEALYQEEGTGHGRH